MEEDRLSELPDYLILHILSLTKPFSSKEIISNTCLLSKRWKSLLTKLSEIELYDGTDDIDVTTRYVNNVGAVLDKCTANPLHRLAVGYRFDKRFDPNLDSWIKFAIGRNVEDITLFNFGGGEDCELPQILYSHSELTTLHIHSDTRVITPRETVNWQSLKSLSISLVYLPDEYMDKLLSGCPVLESLILDGCWGFNYLNISSPTFTTLEIGLSDYDATIDISAPYARYLMLGCGISRRQFILRDVTSLVRASLYFSQITPEYMVELLESLQNVKELLLGDGCIKSLSMLDSKGLKIPTSTRSCLILNLEETKIPAILFPILLLTQNLRENKIPGILCILKSSPYLETLTIQGHGKCLEDDIPDEQGGIYNDLVFDHLKTINITFSRGDQVMKLAQILLMSANVLEKMNLSYVPSEGEEKLTEEEALLALPKSSLKAIVTVEYLDASYFSED